MRVRIEWIACTTEPNMKPHSNSFQNGCMYIRVYIYIDISFTTKETDPFTGQKQGLRKLRRIHVGSNIAKWVMVHLAFYLKRSLEDKCQRMLWGMGQDP
jgi:hypothetical protein